MQTIWQDVKYGIRMLVKHPGFTVVAVLTLALGIGANSAIFSVVNAVLLRPLQFKEPEQLVKLWETLPQQGLTGTVSAPNFLDWREQNQVFAELSAYEPANFSLQGKDQPERMLGVTATAGFFDVISTPPQLGRTFLAGEDQAGRNFVAVISDRLWQRNFGADPQIIGKSITLGGETFTLVGVMPQGFEFPSATTDIWTPLVFSKEQLAERGNHSLRVIGRLKADATLQQAQEQMSTIARRLAEQYPDNQAGRDIKLIRLQEETVQSVRPALLILLGAVGFVLLIACTNVANLLLARAATRRREIAIRTALGAGRARLVRQFLTESLLLSLMGGALGLVVGKWGVDALVALASGFLPRASEIGLDARVLGFTLLLSMLTAIVFGLAPALQISKTDVQEALKEGGSSGSSPRGNWLRSLLAVAEVAAALMLLVGAGLLIRSFMRLQQVDTGLRPENVLTMKITLPEAKYKTKESAVAFHDQVLERVNTLPGVETAGLINILPIQQFGWNGHARVEGIPQSDPPVLVEFRSASTDYFRTLGIPLIAGNLFNTRNKETGAPVVVVNQTFVRQLLAGQEPIGRRINMSSSEANWMTITGVVADVRQSGLSRPTRPEIFIPYTQQNSETQSMSLVVRSTAEPTALTNSIRREVLAVDPNQPIYDVQTMETVIGKSVSNQRLNMLLMGIFAALAMTLALVGIYSVMSYMVTQHTREIGIRIALGAQTLDILKLVLGQGLLLTFIGVGLGLLGAFGLTRLMASLLYEVKSTDPVTFLAVSLLLVAVALLACYLPARRASKVDPMVALRYE
ncbi:MAG TPA: ABC transporter permease [Pyrinomonadaceae bacterium]|nr:ABC transporter permease [Pyrinomonadaceae bacterium]